MRLRAAILVALILPAALVAQSPSAPVAPADRVSAWREDLATFVRDFPTSQYEFDKLYPRARFDEAMHALTSDLPNTSDADIVLGLMRFVSSAHVGHTGVRIPLDGWLTFHRLPITVQWFSDGLAVTATSDEYRGALGLRVTRIGTLTPELLESAVATYISYERDSWLRLQSQTFMMIEEVLRAIGQVEADGRVTLTLARPDGSPLTVRVAAMKWRDATTTVNVLTALNLPLGPTRVDPARYYRWEILPGTKVLYVRYSRCADDPQQAFAVFARELFAAVDATPEAVDRVIVDLRGNGGGDSRIIKPLLDGLRARKSLSARGHLYALTGPATFSSGLLAAWSMKNLKAILVGEAPGENLNSYSEVRTLILPNTGVTIQYATKLNKLGKDGQALEPDVKVTRSLGDLLNGRDPVLEAAIGHR